MADCEQVTRTFSSHMKAIGQLQQRYFKFRHGLETASSLIDWAMERLQNDEEDGDLNIVLLASATEHQSVLPLVEGILKTYAGPDTLDDQLAAGKCIVELKNQYFAGQETIHSLDEKLAKLYSSLNYPDWLTMLSRNCEYAVDIPEFREPFVRELQYVAALWEEASSLDDFVHAYDRNVSNSHDWRGC